METSEREDGEVKSEKGNFFGESNCDDSAKAERRHLVERLLLEGPRFEPISSTTPFSNQLSPVTKKNKTFKRETFTSRTENII